MPEKERLAKRIAHAGLCSRRTAEQWIAAGRVAVNGVTAETPATLVEADDTITVNGQEIPREEKTRVFKLHKPVGVLCSEKDPQNRPLVQGLLPAHLPRLISVGRLDLNSEGLLLLTTDGTLAQTWMRGDWPRLYHVRVRGELPTAGLAKLRRGVTIDGVRYAPIKIEATATDKTGRNRWYRITLTEGKNREIRRVVETIGGQVNRLIRLRYGPFELGNLNKGEVEEIHTW
jgi:23S rRNA pseudouridine2605 synthase